jgi:hypothetical protein
MRFLLLMLAAIGLLSCSEPVAVSAPKPAANITKHDPKQYSLLNEQIVYNARFAEIFGPQPVSGNQMMRYRITHQIGIAVQAQLFH